MKHKKTFRKTLLYSMILAMTVMLLISCTFYIWFSTVIKKKTLDYFENICIKSEQNVNTYLNEMTKVANLVSYSSTMQDYLFESDPYKKISSQSFATDMLDSVMASYSNIKEIALYKEDGTLFQATGAYSHLFRTALSDKSIIPEEGFSTPYFAPIVYNTYNQNDKENPYLLYVYPIYSLVEGEFAPENSAVCLILAKVEDMVKQYSMGLESEDITAAFFEDDTLLFSSREISEKEYGDISKISFGRNTFSVQKKAFLAYRHSFQNANWNMVLIAPESSFMHELKYLQLAALGFLVIASLLLLIILLVEMKAISDPLRHLLRQIGQITIQSDGQRQIAPSSIEEISSISNSINSMLDKIEQITVERENIKNKLYEASLAQKQAQLQYYQSQINPHFLYNTLECIRSMAQCYQADCIERLCLSMARMFRYSVGDAAEVNLSEEISHVQDYFDIISQRFSGRFRLMIQVSEEALCVKMPKMILQPIIENAICHGFDGKDSPCTILIKGYVDTDKKLRLLIADNGYGIPPMILESLNQQFDVDADFLSCKSESGLGIGLFNINKRLRLIYNKANALSISSKYGYYTCVKMTLPEKRARTEAGSCQSQKEC